VLIFHNAVLSFFGILSTTRHNYLSEKVRMDAICCDITSNISFSFDGRISQMGGRNTIHLSKLKTDCRWGDLILFKCSNRLSALQRSVTGAEWDHVGIVVRGSSVSGSGLDLLEATGEGVTSYPLFSRLRAYHDTKVKYIYRDTHGLPCAPD
jgi:hypothetical protein